MASEVLARTSAAEKHQHLSVSIDSAVVNEENVVSYVVQVCESSSGLTWTVNRRYREFRALHDAVKARFSYDLPEFPRKKMFGNKEKCFINQRRLGLECFLQRLIRLDPACNSCAYFSEFLKIPHSKTEPIQESIFDEEHSDSVYSGSEEQTTTETLLSFMKRTMLDLSQPCEKYLDEIDTEEKIALYKKIFEEDDDNHPVIDSPLAEALIQDLIRHTQPIPWSAHLAELSAQQWEKLVFGEVEQIEQRFLHEKIEELCTINDPGRPIYGVRTLFASFPNCRNGESGEINVANDA